MPVGVLGVPGFLGPGGEPQDYQDMLPPQMGGQRPGDLPALSGSDLARVQQAVGPRSRWMDALEWVGDTLGKYGRPVRAALSPLTGGEFRPRELLAGVLFSDTLGLTDPSQQVRGSDLAKNLGVPGSYTPGTGLDWGDVAGLGIDIATDPLTYASFGSGSLFSSGAKATTEAGLAGARAAAQAAAAGAAPAARAAESAAAVARAAAPQAGRLGRVGGWLKGLAGAGAAEAMAAEGAGAAEQALKGAAMTAHTGALTDAGVALGKLGYLPERHAARMAGLSGGVGEDILQRAMGRVAQTGVGDATYLQGLLDTVKAGGTVPLQGVVRFGTENVPLLGRFLPRFGVTLGASGGPGWALGHGLFPGLAQLPWLGDWLKYSKFGSTWGAPLRQLFQGKYLGQRSAAGQQLAEEVYRPMADAHRQVLREGVTDYARMLRNQFPGLEGQAFLESDQGRELLRRALDQAIWDVNQLTPETAASLGKFSGSFDRTVFDAAGQKLKDLFKDYAERTRMAGGHTGVTADYFPRSVLGRDLDHTQFSSPRTFNVPAADVERMVKDPAVSGIGRTALTDQDALSHLRQTYPAAMAGVSDLEGLNVVAGLRDVAEHHRVPGSLYYQHPLTDAWNYADWLGRRLAYTESAAELLAREARHKGLFSLGGRLADQADAEKQLGELRVLGRLAGEDLSKIEPLSTLTTAQGHQALTQRLAKKLGVAPDAVSLNDFLVPGQRVKGVLDSLNRLSAPKDPGSLVRGYDWLSNLTRGWLTVPFPGHWINNLTGSTLLNAASDIYDPARRWLGVLGPMLDASRLMRGQAIPGLAGRGLLGQHATDEQATYALLRWLMGSGSLEHGVGHAVERTGQVNRLLPGAVGTIRMPGDVGFLDPVRRPRQGFWESVFRPSVDRASTIADDTGRALAGLTENELFNQLRRLNALPEFLQPWSVRGVGGRVQSGNVLARLGENVTNWTDMQARVAHQLGRLYQGFDPSVATASMRAGQFDYRMLSPFERDVMRRLFLFYCVPVDDSEILTRNGWRSCDDLRIGEEVLTYNIDGDVLEWQPCLSKAVFDHDQDLNHWSNSRSGDLTFTDGHRWVVYAGRQFVKGRWYGGLENRKVLAADEISTNDNILVAAPLRDGGPSVLSPEDARLVGWIVTDGYHKWTGNFCDARIYQSPSKHLDEVLAVAGGTAYKPHPVTGVVAVNVEIGRRKRIQEFLDKERLPLVVTRLSREAAEAMFDAMMKAEGHEANGSDCFTQKEGPVMDAFVILATMLGKKLGRVAKWGDGMARVYIHKARSTRVAYLDRERIRYSGRVWCPATANGTWVMRQAGAVTITGNSWPRMNLERQVRMLMSNPGRVMPLIRAGEAMSGSQDELPSWLRGRSVIRQGTESYTDPDSGRLTEYARLLALPMLPHEEGLRGWAVRGPGALERSGDFLGGQLAPVPRAFLEKVMGRTFQGHHALGLNRAVEPNYPDWVSYTPLARVYSTANMFRDQPHRPALSMAEKLGQLLGVRSLNVDPAASREQELADQIKLRLQEMGVANDGRVPDELKGRVLADPEAQVLIRAAKTLGIRAQERRLERQVEQAADVLRQGPTTPDEQWLALSMPGLQLKLEAARRENTWLDTRRSLGPNPLMRGMNLGRRLRMLERQRLASYP